MPLTSYTHALTNEQAATLREVLDRENFEFVSKPYTLYAAKKGKLNVAVYEKGPKVLVQGKETEEFVQFQLEPEVLGVAELGYEEVHNPEMFSPHFGIDESGKGDFFGPLVIAGAYVDGEIARTLMDAGIMDSKRITSDARIRQLSAQIREVRGIAYDVVSIGPKRYNELYEKFGNLNRLLAWGHAKVIQNLAEKRPNCPRALSDQFANPRELERALKAKETELTLEQRTKAESDVAVAAASILARENFINWLRDQGEELGLELPRGASKKVKETARELVISQSASVLTLVSKTHFKTAAEVLETI